jgi:hypothetical protein
LTVPVIPAIPIHEKHLEKPVGLLAITCHASDIFLKLNKHQSELSNELQNHTIISFMSHLIANVNMYQYTPSDALTDRASKSWQEKHKNFPLQKSLLEYTEKQLRIEGFIKKRTMNNEMSKLYLTDKIDPFLV